MTRGVPPTPETRIIAIGPPGSTDAPPGIELIADVSAARPEVTAPDVLAVVTTAELPQYLAREIVRSVKSESPSTLVICLDQDLTTEGFVALPDVIGSGWTLDEITGVVAQMLDTPRYSELLIEAFEEAVVEGLGALGDSYLPARFFHRTTEMLPDGCHGMIPWGGGHSSGWLTVSAAPPTICALMGADCSANDSVDDPHAEQARADAACELANQMLGALKRSFARRGASIEVGLPLAFDGDRPPFSYRRWPSTLMVEVQGDRLDPVWVDLAVSSMPTLTPAVDDDEDTELGELVFL